LEGCSSRLSPPRATTPASMATFLRSPRHRLERRMLNTATIVSAANCSRPQSSRHIPLSALFAILPVTRLVHGSLLERSAISDVLKYWRRMFGHIQHSGASFPHFLAFWTRPPRCDVTARLALIGSLPSHRWLCPRLHFVKLNRASALSPYRCPGDPGRAWTSIYHSP